MVSRTIRALRTLSLAAGDGAYLGSENDLLDRLGISRPTLRQAAKVVENERLISVRRGVNGGLYAQRPTMRDVVQLPALWLRMQDAKLADMQVASGSIMGVVSAGAARCEDPALRSEMEILRAQIDGVSPTQDQETVILRDELRLTGQMGRMTGNPVLMLFADIAYAFGMLDHEQRFFISDERRATWRRLQVQLCDALLARDSDIAALIQARRHEAIAGWMAENAEADKR